MKCVLAIAMFVMFEYTQPTVAMVIVASMLMTALDCLYTPTFRAYFPNIVHNDDLPSVNSAIQVIEDVSSIIGPLIFSLIAIVLAPSYAFAFFSVSLLVSAACMLMLLSSARSTQEPFNVLAIFKEATRSVGSLRKFNKPLFTVICCTTLCAMFATSVIRFILPAAVIENFHSEAAVGYIFSLLALGTVMGGMLYVKFNATTTARSVIIYWLLYGVLFLSTAIALQFNTYLFVFYCCAWVLSVRSSILQLSPIFNACRIHRKWVRIFLCTTLRRLLAMPCQGLSHALCFSSWGRLLLLA